MPLLLFAGSLYSTCSSKFQYFATVLRSSSWPAHLRTPFSTLHPSALLELTPVHPVRSLPSNSCIGLSLLQLPSSCSSISGERYPVNFKCVAGVVAGLVTVRWSRPLTYFTSYSARSFGFGVCPL